MKIKIFAAKNWKKIVIALVVVGGLFFFLTRNKKTEVKTETIKRGELKEELVLSGAVDAANHAKLGFETSGKIVYVGVKEGEKVKKGRLISKLDTTILNSTYQTALSNLRKYEATVQNIHDQVKDHSGDETYAQKDTRTTAEVNKDNAYEAVIQAKRSLDGASLYAPFAGYVTYLAHPFTGVYTSLAAVEAEIIDPTTMYFDVVADQTEVTKLKVGQDVEIVLDPFEETNFNGKIANISFVPKSGETGSVYAVKVDFNGTNLENSQIKISMSGDAKFVTSKKENILYVPQIYVKQDKSGKYIKLDAAGKNKVYVETGIESEDNIEITGNISEGTTIYD